MLPQQLQQQQQYYASQPTQAVQGRPRGNANGTGKRPGFASRATMVFGIFQIIFGGICVLQGITAVVIVCKVSESGTGIWCGVMFAVAGSFGIAASLKKTNAMIITTMVLSIISATMAGIACIISVFAAVIEENCYQWDGDWYPYYCDTEYDGRVAVDSLLAVVALAELVIAVLQSAFCCSAYCCNQKLSASPMYIALRTSAGANNGFPVTVIQNEPKQQMAPSGVELVPHYPNHGQVPQGYVLKCSQSAAISNWNHNLALCINKDNSYSSHSNNTEKCQSYRPSCRLINRSNQCYVLQWINNNNRVP
ncbi:membrane-spanning 4-domains subfamily A member 4D-like [Ptychodera flava]|uniref:membrane-spanning 4-domains subfamily A member 4D-like n=1 Tax=Ptychodera flava TaxID=63121 RepID=UPI003969F583